MSDHAYITISVLIMIAVTYLVRAIPLVFFRREIKNRWFRSFLYYIPYAVLAAMTFPAIFRATGNLVSGIVAAVAAVILAFFRRSLLIVAAGAAASALVCELIVSWGWFS